MDPHNGYMYTDSQKRLQASFDTSKLAEVIERNLIEPTISDHWKAFIERLDMVFIATVNHLGRPACSYKGGSPGFVRVVAPDRLMFPLYDGNGLFVTAGNLEDTGFAELLFVDFAEPQRLRVGGRARVAPPDADEAALYPEALLIVHLAVAHCYVNCRRYVHRQTRRETSPYVPQLGAEIPVAAWKLLPYVEPHLSRADREEIARRRRLGLPLPEPDGQAPADEAS